MTAPSAFTLGLALGALAQTAVLYRAARRAVDRATRLSFEAATRAVAKHHEAVSARVREALK